MLFGWKGDCFLRTLPDSEKRKEAELEEKAAVRAAKRAKKVKEKEVMKPPMKNGPPANFQPDPAAIEAKVNELSQEITLHVELQTTLLEIGDVEMELGDLDTRPVDMPILLRRLHLANAKKARVEACILKIRCTKIERERDMIRAMSAPPEPPSMLFRS